MSKLPSGLEDPEDFWKAIHIPQESFKFEDELDISSDLEESIDLTLDSNDELILNFHDIKKDKVQLNKEIFEDNDDFNTQNNDFDDEYIGSQQDNFDELNDPSFSLPYENNNNIYDDLTPKPKKKNKRKGQGRFIYERIVTPTFSRGKSGIRRSKRKRTAPLEYWRNEKPHYAVSPSTGTRVRIGSFKRETPPN